MSFNIPDLLSKTDLVDLIRRAGSNPHQRFGEWRSNCPIHHGDNDSAFAIYESHGVQKWKCFTRDCGGGDAIDFVMKYNQIDFPAACRMLGGEEADPTAIRQAAELRAQRAAEDLVEAQANYDRALTDLEASQIWETYHEALEQDSHLRDVWRCRGIPDEWQNFWKLGYRPVYKVHTNSGTVITPTITIPIHGAGWKVLNIRHRLLNPINPKDKYRPERAGLRSVPFISDPDKGFNAERVLVVEGEIKAMVTFLTLDTPGLQVVGIPGKQQWHGVSEQVRGRDVYVLFDPDALTDAIQAAKEAHGKIISLPVKIDDAILARALDKGGISRLMKQARKV